ncbi:hypothetical protein HDU67_009536 [Dinochytrium kinnereticum]|nr:hypothetical protein HDU67_009536 [Dinochytrium kinnereticum]
MCVSWTYQATAPQGIIYTLSSASHQGWIGLGLGPASTMAGAKLYIVSQGGVTTLSTAADDHSPTIYQGKADVDGRSVATPETAYVVPAPLLSGSFFKPLSSPDDPADVAIAAAVHYIWAVSSTPPISAADVPSIHDSRGEFGPIPDVLNSAGSGNAAATRPPVSSAPVSIASTTTATTTRAAPLATQSSTPLTGSTKATGTFCTSSNSLCLTVVRDATTNLATFIVQSTYTGYTAIGIGSRIMAGATIYVAWPNGSGGYTLSQRTSTGYTVPAFSATQGIDSVAMPSDPSVVKPLAGAVMQFAFTRPATNDTSGAPSVSVSGATDFIWAGFSGSVPPTTAASASFPKHATGNYGSFQIDVSKVGTTSTGSAVASQYDVQQMRMLHGVFMFIGWAVLPYIGIFVARYMKDRMGHAWYLTHMGIMIGGVGICTLVGLVLIELPVVGARFFSTYHGIFGTVLALAIFPLQCALGFISNHLWSPNRTSIPWWDQLHWWLGRVSVLASVPIMYFGLKLFEAPNLAYVGLFLWIGVCAVVLVAGQFAIGVVHHVKKRESLEMRSGLGSGTRTDYRGKF